MSDESKVFQLSADNFETNPETIIEGHKVRPHIVFFQEAVPNFEPAVKLVREADIFVIIGTSLVVYPAASLLNYAPYNAEIYYIDPCPTVTMTRDVETIAMPATSGVKKLAEILRNK